MGYCAWLSMTLPLLVWCQRDVLAYGLEFG